MTKSIEVSAKTEDEATQIALEQLGLTRDDVSVEIIERAKTGFLGLKSSPAIVRVSYEADDEIITEDSAVSPVNSTINSPVKPVSTKSTDSIVSGDSDDTAERVEAFLSGLLARMDVQAKMQTSEDDDGSINIVLSGSDPGALIGRRGETLDAMQHLANYVINKGADNRVRINLDAENYRQRRNEMLEQLAEKSAQKVMKYRRNITLDPMNAYERHIIHTALQKYNNISTHSVGSEPYRRVVVSLGRRNDNREHGGNRNNSRAAQNNNNNVNARPSQNAREWS